MTAIFLALIGLMLAYELIALRQAAGYTISEIIWHVAYRYPLVPFAFGALMGHFFWQSSKCIELIR